MTTDIGPECSNCGETLWTYAVGYEDGGSEVSARCACCHREGLFWSRIPLTNVTDVRRHHIAMNDVL